MGNDAIKSVVGNWFVQVALDNLNVVAAIEKPIE